MPRPHSPGLRIAVFGTRLLLVLLLPRLPLSAQTIPPSDRPRVFNVPAGEAVDTIKQTAQQGGVEIVFLAETVRGVRTAAVRGKFTPRDALDRLVNNTGLKIIHDERTGTLTVSTVDPADPKSPKSNPKKTSTLMKQSMTARLLAAITLSSSTLGAQTSPPTPAPSAVQEEAITLSPFSVSADKDTGYLASGTLAGSRLNTSLYDTPASISVMTKDFLQDVGATSVADALSYSLNAEPDRTDTTGNPSGSGDLPVSIRGFGGSSLGRNYFQWGLESDTFNTERLDFSRGPNSILFGTGGPGGIINTTTKRALFGREIQQLGVRLGAWDNQRATFDYSRQLTQSFALRINGLLQEAKSWQDFVESKRKGLALAMTFRPFKNTEIRFDGEYGEYDRVLANPFLPGDAVTPWLNAGKPLSATFGTVVTGTTRSTSRVYIHDPYTGTVASWFGSVNTNSAGSALSAGIPRALTNFSVVPLKATLSGSGNLSNSRYLATGVFIEQKVGPFWFEAAANRQDQGRLWLTSTNWGDTTVRADANSLLPNGQPNPNVGKLYVESNAQQTTSDVVTDDLRATGAYTLDLNKVSPWLGTYSITGLASKRVNKSLSDNLFEVNATPAGDATYPLDITNANNRVLRRVYLDPFGSGPKGGVDARQHLVAQGGVNSAFRRVQNQGTVGRDELTSSMVAAQGKLLKDRLVVTGGVRRDKQKNFAGTATQLAVTREFTLQALNPNSIDFEGDTRTFGAVVHLTSWLSGFYNKSDNFAPQSTLTINGSQLGPRSGKGEDYGAKFRLLDGKLYASLTRYNTSEINRQVFADGGLVNAINEVFEATGDPTRVAGPTSRDGIDTEGKGYEFEITANLTKQWRFTLNFAKTEGTQANNQPRNRAYVAERRAGWLAKGSLPLIAPISGVPVTDPRTGLPSTVSTALDTIDNFITTILGANGVTRRQLREYTGSAFSAYTFRADSPYLDQLTLGAGVRYRSEPVVGYVGGLTPIYGKGDTLVNLLIKKPARLFGRQVQFQANLDNLLNVNDPIVVDADINGQYRFLYPTPFRWSLSATMNF
ncbi:MAG: TonB-dependent receptor plug domain-containing protein [Opitutaceae bacterium]|nr:TonB-dependent receptor plug domain-containing protein [Opitutaceae bacterium]